nr:NUDIX domain-containing protein [Gemmobacter straminiformis]
MEVSGEIFVYGTLCHAPLLAVVLGREARPAAAWVAGAVVRAGPCAALVSGEGRVAGKLLVGLTPAEVERVAYYAAVLGQGVVLCRAETDAGQCDAVLYTCGSGDGAWQFDLWAERFGAIAVATARDVMALQGQVPAAQVARRYGQMLVRGAARVRSADAGPVTLRRSQRAGDVAVAASVTPYAHFFAVEEQDLSFRRFDGSMGPTVNRAAFVMGDAVTVLPYDPVRDRVLLVEQFRAGPHMRGAVECWSLEAIAGRVDPGETPEEAARREAVEEAGLELGAMEYVAGYYPSPGAVTEYLYSYVALADLPDGAAGVFGVEGEAEDIRGHLVGFARFMELVASGEVDNAPLMLTALWLQRERGRLRQG